MESDENIVDGVCSELKREWLDEEITISHCAVNQLTYLLAHKRREMRLHLYYGTDQAISCCNELIDMRRHIFRHFD
jgi:hypothetical protein